MRIELSQRLVELALNDEKVILITGDHGYALFDEFRKICPGQYLNAGIAEQNIVGLAAGLAKQGFRPIVYGLSAFIPIRVLEQIKIDVAHDQLPIIFLGDGAGFVYSHLGTSHQCVEDVAALRAIPNVQIYSPADRYELAASLSIAYESAATAYIRLGKADLGDIHESQPISVDQGFLPLPINQENTSRVAFIGTGSMVHLALQLAKQAIPGSTAWSAPKLSGLADSDFLKLIESADVFVTLEEHSVKGGLGGLVAETLANISPKWILRIGVENRFSEFCGSYQYLLSEHGLDYESVSKKVKEYLNQVSKTSN